MDKHAISIKEKLTVYTSSNTVTLPSSEHNKVYIWGYELCKGSDWNNFLEVVNKLGEENKQLKEQLAEKDKEIEQLKKYDDLNKTFFAVFRTAFKEPNKVDDLFNTLKTIQEKQHQDKISFAVEQLTLFKNSIVNKMNNPYSVNIKHILSDFDNQIKELTHQHEDK